MHIELNDAEHQELLHLVEERLRVLRSEIGRTATHDFKMVLKDHERVLDKLLEKLKLKEVVY